MRSPSDEGWDNITFSTAAWKLAPRDRFIGWTPQLREMNLPLVVDTGDPCYPWYMSLETISQMSDDPLVSLPAVTR